MIIRTIALGCVTWAVFGTAVAGPSEYPAAARGAVVDRYHGRDVPDPYRWLEDNDNSATKTWLAEEAALTARRLAALPGRTRIEQRLGELMRYRRPGVPWREGGEIYWTEVREGDEQAVLFATDRPGGAPKVVFDPNRISPDGSLAMSDFLVSPDGKRLAYRAATGGSDVGEIRVRDLDADRDMQDVVRGYNPCWTRDGRGFFYAESFRRETNPEVRAGMRAFYHRIGDAQSADRRLMKWDARAGWVYFMVSEDGHYAAFVAEEGMVSEAYVMDLRRGESAVPFEVLDGVDAFYTPLDWVGDTLFLRTNDGAPRTRVVAIDLRDGAAAKPREIVPECADVITDAIITDGHLVINYLADVSSRLRLFALDGTPAGEIKLPGIGSVGWPLSGRPSTPELFFSFESFLSPATLYTCDVSAGSAVPYGPVATLDMNRFETTQIFFPSRDGTRVPMFVTAPKNLKLDGSHPVFLTGYGGYGSTMDPSFSPDVPLWLEMGGIYVLANIRGGGEYGEEWHRAGMLEKKQTSFDDFIAAAEYLIEKGYTRKGKIAVHGHSNGGLLMGAVLTQRPDLWGAVVANAGHYDMLRYHRFTAGAGWVSEYGSADDPAQFDFLHAYSPLQNVKPGTCYPPTLLLAADHDDRVVPAHSYKFAAALQAAQSCDAPILLRVAQNASHSYSSRQEMIAERTDMWSFIAASLGVSP